MQAVGALVFDTSVGRCGVVAGRRVGDRSSAVRVFYPSSDPPSGGEEAASQREAWRLRAVTYARDVKSAGYADCAMWLLRTGRWEAREHLRIVVDSLLQNVLPATEAVSMDMGWFSVASICEGVGTFSQTVREFVLPLVAQERGRSVEMRACIYEVSPVDDMCAAIFDQHFLGPSVDIHWKGDMPTSLYDVTTAESEMGHSLRLLLVPIVDCVTLATHQTCKCD